MNTLDLVKEFYKASGCRLHKNKKPVVPNYDQALLKVKFLNEELSELCHAFVARDKVKILDALTDLQYFLDGTYILCGMEDLKDKAFIEVHRSNMTKFYTTRDSEGNVQRSCVKDDAGKIIKPMGYDPPNLKQFIEEKSHEVENHNSVGDTSNTKFVEFQ